MGVRFAGHGWIAAALACALAIVLVPVPTKAGEARVVINDTRLSVPIKTFKDLRDANVVRQRLDYSCGAAALATLMTYGLGRPTTEAEVIKSMLADLQAQEKLTREREGFSLLDMKRFAESVGLKAQGFRLKPEALDKLKGQVIVFLKPLGYEHFSVLRGVRGTTVYLADPSRGNIRLSKIRFLDEWVQPDGRGIVFAVERPGEPFPRDNPLSLDAPPGETPERISVRELIDIRPRIVPGAP